MKADKQVKTLHELFGKPENASIDPRKSIAIDDDSQIIEIHAEKLIGDPEDHWYEVQIRGE